MPKATVIGAGPSGSATALLLADRGFDVIVLDRDAGPLPSTVDEAWTDWKRSVGQFHQAHLTMSRFRHLLDAHLPEVRDELEALGANRYDFLAQMPAALRDRGERPDDDRFITLTARRPVLDLGFQRVIDRHPAIEVRRGVAVAGLVAVPGIVEGVPHVVGARTADGEEHLCDVVIDASGRRSPLPRMLVDAGAVEPPVSSIDDGFVYYTRAFRSPEGRYPEFEAPALTPLGSMSLLCLHADHATWSVTIYTSSKDRALRGMRDIDGWERVVRAHPTHVHWLDGDPITDSVDVMVSHVGRRRSLVVDDHPVATGVVAVGDAWACTNPSIGRGITLGVLHAVHTAEVLSGHIDEPTEVTSAWQAVTDRELGPWYEATVELDQARLAEIDAERNGIDPPARDPDDPAAAVGAALAVGAANDADVFRLLMEFTCCLSLPIEAFGRAGVLDRVLDAARGRTAPDFPRPTREELEDLVSG